MKTQLNKTILSIAIIMLFNSQMSAQGINYKILPNDNIQIGLEFNKPLFSKNSKTSTLSGVYELSANVPISNKFNITAEIPFINYSYEFNTPYYNSSYNENGFGNIFIGMETNSTVEESRKDVLSFGVFLPTANERVGGLGLYSSYYEIQKFIPNTVGLFFNLSFYKLKEQGIIFGVEFGPNILIPTKDKNADTEAFLHYGMITGYKIDRVLINAEILGIVVLTEDPDKFGDRFVHSIDLGVKWKGELIQPRLYYKIYLREEMKKVVDGIIGIGLDVSISG